MADLSIDRRLVVLQVGRLEAPVPVIVHRLVDNAEQAHVVRTGGGLVLDLHPVPAEVGDRPIEGTDGRAGQGAPPSVAGQVSDA